MKQVAAAHAWPTPKPSKQGVHLPMTALTGVAPPCSSVCMWLAALLDHPPGRRALRVTEVTERVFANAPGPFTSYKELKAVKLSSCA